MGMDGEGQRKVVEKFPEVVGLPVETLRASVARLESGFFIKGKVATKTLLRRPDVLGMDFDCEGDCKGQCHLCWVRFFPGGRPTLPQRPLVVLLVEGLAA